MKSPLKKYVENLKSRQLQKPKVIGEYIDPKYGVPVKVYQGVKEVPFKSLPVGGGE